MTMGTTAAAFEMDIPAGGAMFPIAGAPSPQGLVQINLADLTPVQVYNPATGAPIPGQSATYQQIFAMVYSIVQARRVAQNAVAAATPGF